MKRPLFLLALVPALTFLVWTGQADGSSENRPLDLPSGGIGDGEDDEDAPETINFYGSEYEGEAFFWCFHAFNF